MRQDKNFEKDIEMNEKLGKLIVVDGGEGSGTTSIVAFLAEQFRGRAIQTREPGGSPLAEKIREFIFKECKDADAETMLALFWAARRDHFVRTIKPALYEGRHVFTDRFLPSTWAYQLFAQDGRYLSDLFFRLEYEFLEEYEVDKYIILDVPPKIGLARAKHRGGNLTHFDKRKISFHNKVREGYHDFVSTVSQDDYVIVDAGQSLEVVQKQVLKIVKEVIG